MSREGCRPVPTRLENGTKLLRHLPYVTHQVGMVTVFRSGACAVYTPLPLPSPLFPSLTPRHRWVPQGVRNRLRMVFDWLLSCMLTLSSCARLGLRSISVATWRQRSV